VIVPLRIVTSRESSRNSVGWDTLEATATGRVIVAPFSS
jgi:hypothetical protein